VDNGDGTVTDIQTGLMWAKTTGTVGSVVTCSPPFPASCADPTGVNNVYEWSSSASSPSNTAPDGALFTDFLAKMNCTVLQSGERCGPGLHRDWRVPTIAELQTIVDCSFTPCIDPIFGPTVAGLYWSSSSAADDPRFAWLVNFDGGNPVRDDQASTCGRCEAAPDRSVGGLSC
jgi:hypothetical protein